MKTDPLDILKRGDGGGDVWDAIEGRLAADLPTVPRASRLAERLGLDGTPVEAALRSPPVASGLGLAAGLIVLAGGLLGGGLAPALLLAGPLLSAVAGGLTVYSALEPGDELTRATGQAPLLVLARHLLVWLGLSVPLLLALPWLPPGFLAAWLLPCLLTHSLALAVGIHLGSLAGLIAGALTWLWLAADMTARLGQAEWRVPPFPTSTAQILALILALLAAVLLAGRPQRIRSLGGRA